jgi:hypothetical protein
VGNEKGSRKFLLTARNTGMSVLQHPGSLDFRLGSQPDMTRSNHDVSNSSKSRQR